MTSSFGCLLVLLALIFFSNLFLFLLQKQTYLSGAPDWYKGSYNEELQIAQSNYPLKPLPLTPRSIFFYCLPLAFGVILTPLVVYFEAHTIGVIPCVLASFNALFTLNRDVKHLTGFSLFTNYLNIFKELTNG